MQEKRLLFFDNLKFVMIRSDENAVHLDSGCQPDGVAQRNGVERFKSGCLGKNCRVNNVNKLNRQEEK